MDRIALVTERVELIGQVQDNEQIEFDPDGSVRIVRSLIEWIKRKNPWSEHSRETTLAGLQNLLDTTNDIISGVLQQPRVKTDCKFLGVNDAPNVEYAIKDEEILIVDNANNHQQVFCNIFEQEKQESLMRLSRALGLLCAALNRMASSKRYKDDIETGAGMLRLISYAAEQNQQILRAYGKLSEKSN